MQIIFATKNKGKIKEIQEIMDSFCVLSMQEAGIDIDVIEDGITFEENAIKKAVEINKICNKVVLADDSGLEIDYLGKEPGVYSSRYLGENTPYDIKNRKILEMMESVPVEQRSARFVCVIAAAFNGRVESVRATIEGIIGFEIKGSNGFGYDPIFYIPEKGKTMAQLSINEKNEISHRGKALRKMKQLLIELGN